MNFAYAVKSGENCLADGVQRVLERATVMLGKGLQQSLSDAVPDWAEFDFVTVVKPFRANGRRKNPIAIFFQRGVQIAKKTAERGFRCLQYTKVLNPGTNGDSFAGSNQCCCALFRARCAHERESMRLRSVRNA